MKKYFNKIALVSVSAMLMFNISCQDELENFHKDPGKYAPNPETVLSGSFSKIMSRERNFKNDYGEVWWHSSTGGMIFQIQLVSRSLNASQGLVDLNKFISYTMMNVDNYFYGHNYDFKELNTMNEYYGKLSVAEQANNKIYITLTKLVREYRASKAVDLYNNVPYSEGMKGVDGSFFPKYDDASEIYKSIIDNLDVFAEEALEDYKLLSGDGKEVFAKQDIIFKGDITKWVEFANAVRLRLAVRISGVEEAFAKTTITEIISKGKLPAKDLMIAPAAWVSKDGDHWKRGLKERDYAAFISPSFTYRLDIDRDHLYTEGIDDPRLPVLIMPNREKMYMPVSFELSSVNAAINRWVTNDNIKKYGYTNFNASYVEFKEAEPYLKYNAYSYLNAATFVRNEEPWRAFTRAEVDLLLAEIELKSLGTTGTPAATHVKNAVVSSIDYWYYINSFTKWDAINESNKKYFKPDPPSASVKDTYAQRIADAYTAGAGEDAKMAVIMNQKYIHLNIHDYFEVFAELRRTRLPKLGVRQNDSNINNAIKPMVERWPYPAEENSLNGEELRKNATQDNFYTPIFWVPANKKEESYYDAGYDDDYLYTNYPGVIESIK